MTSTPLMSTVTRGGVHDELQASTGAGRQGTLALVRTLFWRRSGDALSFSGNETPGFMAPPRRCEGCIDGRGSLLYGVLRLIYDPPTTRPHRWRCCPEPH